MIQTCNIEIEIECCNIEVDIIYIKVFIDILVSALTYLALSGLKYRCIRSNIELLSSVILLSNVRYRFNSFCQRLEQ